MAELREVGWLRHLPAEPLWAFLAAPTLLYKLAGIDLVLEQLRKQLAGPTA